MAVALYGALLVAFNLASHGNLGRMMDELWKNTHGWVAVDWLLPLTSAVVALPIFLRWHLRVSDVAWRASAILPAATMLVLFWTTMQVVLVIETIASGGSPAVNSSWRSDGSAVLAYTVAHLFGAALAEETFFRGYLLRQVAAVVARSTRRRPRWLAVGVGSAISLVLFVLSHVPRALLDGGLGSGTVSFLVFTAEFGLIITLVFLVTNNLFVCVGLHALWNARPMLVEASQEAVDATWWSLTALLVVATWLDRGRIARDAAPKSATGSEPVPVSAGTGSA